MASSDEVSTLTSKGQTTIPRSVRRALGLSPGDKIAFRLDEDGVSIRRADHQDDDPALAGFLAFLAQDLEHRPEVIAGLSPALMERLNQLVGHLDVDLEAAIDGEVDL